MGKRTIGIILAGVAVIAGLFFVFTRGNSSETVAYQQNPADFPLLARRIFLEDPNEQIINFSELRGSLYKYFEEQNVSGSLYFEYLPTGTSIRINGEEKEVAASLLKLPAAMELYKASELGLVDLNQTVKLRTEWLDDKFGTLYQKGPGYELSIEDAVKIMLVDSDNTALKVVSSSISGKLSPEDNPFNFLDAEFSQNPDLSVSISARAYTSFLKCLYFSCYLNKEHSQEILDYLSQSSFNDRLVAGVSDDVTVAHKVGNFAESTQSDCGIVYLERRNYALCVMIEGPDSDTTDSKIAEISRLTFDYLKNR